MVKRRRGVSGRIIPELPAECESFKQRRIPSVTGDLINARIARDAAKRPEARQKEWYRGV